MPYGLLITLIEIVDIQDKVGKMDTPHSDMMMEMMVLRLCVKVYVVNVKTAPDRLTWLSKVAGKGRVRLSVTLVSCLAGALS